MQAGELIATAGLAACAWRLLVEARPLVGDAATRGAASLKAAAATPRFAAICENAATAFAVLLTTGPGLSLLCATVLAVAVLPAAVQRAAAGMKEIRALGAERRAAREACEAGPGRAYVEAHDRFVCVRIDAEGR